MSIPFSSFVNPDAAGTSNNRLSHNGLDTVQYYESFRKFLAIDSAFDATHKKKLQVNRAQQKLLRLSSSQFHELTTDVYDEMQRRIVNTDSSSTDDGSTHLEPEETLHPKRNQARKKLSLLSASRFNDLACDLLFEIERRTPNLKQLSQHMRSLSDESVTGPSPQHDKQKDTEIHTDSHTDSQTESAGIPVSSLLNEPTSPVQFSHPPVPQQPTFGFGESQSDNAPAQPSEHFSSPPSTAVTNSHRSNQNSTSTASTFYSEAPSVATANTEYSSTIVPQEEKLKPEHDSLFANFDSAPAPVLFINTQKSSEPQSSASSEVPPSQSPQQPTTTALPTTLPSQSFSHAEPTPEKQNASASGSGTYPAGLSAAMQAWAHKNNSQADLNNFNQQQPADFSSEEEESSDEDSFDGDFDQSPALNRNIFNSDATVYPSATGSFHELDNDLTRGFRLQSIEEETSPYIPPSMLTQGAIAGVKRRSLSETMSSSIPGGARSRSFHKLESTLGADNASAYKVQLNEKDEQLKDKDAEIGRKDKTIKEKEDQINELVEEGTRMDQKVSELEARLAKLQDQKDAATKENDRLLALVSETETSKSDLQKEFDSAKTQHATELEEHINRVEERQRSLADLEIAHQKLKDKHAATMSKQSEFAGSSASLTSQITLLEGKLLKQENTITSLKQELEEARANNESQKVDVEAHAKLQQRHDALEEEHRKLHVELEQQQKVTDQVREEASAFLAEMRTLAEQESPWDSEKHNETVERLKSEAAEWKTRYAKSKVQIRSMRSANQAANSAFKQYDLHHSLSSMFSKHGMIYDSSVTKFQTAIDNFVLNSRSSSTKTLLDCLHNVVVATRVITQDVGSSPSEHVTHQGVDVDEYQGELAQATSLVSATANNLITTTRNHSSSGGLAPLFLLDAAASDLSGAVLELIKLAHVRPSPSRKDRSATARRGSNERKVSNGSSTYGKYNSHSESSHQLDSDIMYTPQSKNGGGAGRYDSSPYQDYSVDSQQPHLEGNTVLALQEYLENQTVGVIDGIQDLLTGIKGTSPYSQLRRSITNITHTVRSILAATSNMMSQPQHWQLKEQGTFIVSNLDNCCQRMQVLYKDSSVFDEKLIPDKHFKQRLAGISFDMAKCTTELVKTVEEVNLKAEINHIDDELDR